LAPDGSVVRELGAGTGTDLGEFADWGPTEIEASHELAPQNQYIWVADPGNTRVQAFGLDGQPRLAVGSVGDGDGELCSGCVGHLATSPRGDLYVTEQSAQQRVLMFDWRGQFVRSFHGRLGEDSRFAPLTGIDYAVPFRLFLSDPRRRIQVFTSEGEYVEEVDTHALHPAIHIQPGDLSAGDDRRLYLADEWNHRVHVLGSEYPVGWRVEWFDDAWLTGPPLVVDVLDDVDLDLGAGSPHPELRLNDFSARLTLWHETKAAPHRFVIDADGGIRLWIDGDDISETWDEREMVRVVDKELATGWHFVELHYCHDGRTEAARLQVSIEQQGPPFTRTATPEGGPATPTYQVTSAASPSATGAATGEPSRTPSAGTASPTPRLTPSPTPTPSGGIEIRRVYLPLTETADR
jgi:hypothetical protein